jgi:hypothetical protein
MTLAEVQKEVANWDAGAQRKLMAFLAALSFQREGLNPEELSRMADDKNPENWISLKEVHRRLSDRS